MKPILMLVFTFCLFCFSGCENDQVLLEEQIELSPKKADPGCYCLDVYDPVCGTDGKTYSNACYARCAGVEVAGYDACS